MSDVFQMVTDRILDMLSTNTIPWHCPWIRTGASCISYSTGRPYSLLNQLLLGGQPGEYITFNQAKAAGGNVRKGEKSRFVVFWKLLEGKDKDTGEIITIPLLKYYNVFRIDQCEHILPRWAVSVQPQQGGSLVPDEKGEKLILDYVDRSGVTYIADKSDRAYYSPASDTIVVPELAQFTELSEFYSCAFHEIIHSTGAEKRLNRLGDCSPRSLLAALMTAAQLGLEFNTPLGQCYLIPRYNGKTGKLDCCFQLGYRGLIDLAYRSGEVTTVGAYVVYEHDEFDYELGLEPKLRHKPNLNDRGAPVYYYALFKTKAGGYGIDVMTIADMRRFRDEYSKAAAKGFSPWDTCFDEMAKKTVLKRCLKYAPLKPEFISAASTDDSVKTELSADMASLPDEKPVQQEDNGTIIEASPQTAGKLAAASNTASN